MGLGIKLLVLASISAFVLPLLTCGACWLGGGGGFDSRSNKTVGDVAALAVYAEWVIAIVLLIIGLCFLIGSAVARRKDD